MLFNLLLLFVLSICLITDLKSRKIYNIVIFPSLLLTFLLHFISDGFAGLGFSFLGFIVGFSILLIPYFLGGMGAGDVKLLALIGAMKGMQFVIVTSIYMALLGGLIGLLVLLFRKGALQRVRSIIYSLSGIRSGVRIPLYLDKEGLKTTYPYGVAIAGGAALSLFYKGWGIL
ncbi:A24 family peptidase [Bacillus suaedaesalsae]|uniref:Prepilin peptidase n=1 Tax=Bacillus suaedaesalsae TaxID=2810349 RepID=A0ABS2DPD0_9BACI|nr:prepilin peptidase [Bacillus suaedaesalsae]MBM6619513.1 prepilin peptidase [Bacillus suaedaesalsae]